jgi:hypothetical protein
VESATAGVTGLGTAVKPATGPNRDCNQASVADLGTAVARTAVEAETAVESATAGVTGLGTAVKPAPTVDARTTVNGV